MIELRVTFAHGLVEAVEEWFNELTRCPWGIEQTGANGPLQLFGYFDDEASALAAWDILHRAFPVLSPKPAISTIDDRDWKEAYKARLKPWATGDLHWVPVWLRDTYPIPRGHTRLLFDAGLAFGTGDHATTRLMAGRLMEFRKAIGLEKFASARIMDAGCGSGILALSAALLGCRHVFAFDRDPEAIHVSRENLIVNGLKPENVEFAHAGIEEAVHGRSADLILANIQADVLALHADDLASIVAPGGTLALSGILAEEVGDVRAGFEPVLSELWNFPVPDDLSTFGDSRIMDNWCDLVFVRPQ